MALIIKWLLSPGARICRTQKQTCFYISVCGVPIAGVIQAYYRKKKKASLEHHQYMKIGRPACRMPTVMLTVWT